MFRGSKAQAGEPFAYRSISDSNDFLRVDDRHIGILIADVSGHGVPAALIASMVKVAIAAQMPHADDPARVIAGINQILCGKMQGQSVSAAYLYLGLESHSFRYAAAGHPPLLWARSTGQSVESVEQNRLILGVFGGAPYTSMERSAQPGDRFLLYTDGLLKALTRRMSSSVKSAFAKHSAGRLR